MALLRFNSISSPVCIFFESSINSGNNIDRFFFWINWKRALRWNHDQTLNRRGVRKFEGFIYKRSIFFTSDWLRPPWRWSMMWSFNQGHVVAHTYGTRRPRSYFITLRSSDQGIHAWSSNLQKALPIKISGFSEDEALEPEYIPCRIKIPRLPYNSSLIGYRNFLDSFSFWRFSGRYDFETVLSISVIPSTSLQPGTSHRQSTRGSASLILALFTAMVRMPRITITKYEVLSRYGEILQLCVFGDSIIIRILQCRYQMFILNFKDSNTNLPLGILSGIPNTQLKSGDMRK